MLNIIYGREDVNKEKFAYEMVPEKTMVIVPDQYTLEGEKDALKYQKKTGLAEMQILSFSRIGTKIFQKVGAPKFELIDKQGRHILLTKIMKEEAENLLVFKNQETRTSFIEMVNNTISQLKQNGKSPEIIDQVIEELEENSFLKRKLMDINGIYKRYQEEIKGRYTDTEDLIDLYTRKINDWEYLRDREVLIYGFDYFTPKNLQVIGELIKYSKKVTVVLTMEDKIESRDYDTFAITRKMRDKLIDLAAQSNAKTLETLVSKDMGDQYVIKKGNKLMHLEKEIYSLPFELWDSKSLESEKIETKGGEYENNQVTLLRAANIYLEAESAASYIINLTRDKGLQFKDIVIICNDLSTRGDIYQRVFKKYGIDVFMDQNERISNQPLVRYILCLIKIFTRGYRKEDVIAFAKTGLTRIEEDQLELLEKYSSKYSIRGKKWKEKFASWEEKEELWLPAEAARSLLIDGILQLETDLKSAKTVKEKISRIYKYLKEEAEIPAVLEGQIEFLESEGRNEEALILAQMWTSVLNTFTQLIEVAGGESLSLKEIGELLKSGFDGISLGTVPPSADTSIMGTVQRTRTGDLKALVIMGANEGLLPMDVKTVEILTEEEKEALSEREVNFMRLNQLKREEEELAIYKMLSKATEYLWISYSLTNQAGDEEKPAQIFEKIKEIFPEVKILDDVENKGIALDENSLIDMVASKGSAADFLGKKLRDSVQGEALDPVWLDTARWFKENDPRRLEAIKKGLKHSNKEDKIREELVGPLYGEDRTISPSRIELYARCPFAQFVKYGLRPREDKNFKVEAMDAGNIYHQVLMELAKELTKENKLILEEDSLWQTLTKVECDKKVEAILERVSKEYRKGLLHASEEEVDKGRRILWVCRESAWAMVSHVQKGMVEGMLFEQAFGKGKKLPPITIDLSQGEKKGVNKEIYIEGQIDRVDQLPEGYIKVIDYKSSKVKFDKDKAKKGWAVQLFLYLKAASEEGSDNGEARLEGSPVEKKPAGTFYFYIDYPIIGAESLGEDVADKVLKEYKMDGIILNEEKVLEYIDRSLKDGDSKSDIISASKTKANTLSKTNLDKILEEKEFALLREEVFNKVKELGKNLYSGKIEIEPTHLGSGQAKESACEFCNYKGICKNE